MRCLMFNFCLKTQYILNVENINAYICVWWIYVIIFTNGIVILLLMEPFLLYEDFILSIL